MHINIYSISVYIYNEYEKQWRIIGYEHNITDFKEVGRIPVRDQCKEIAIKALLAILRVVHLPVHGQKHIARVGLRRSGRCEAQAVWSKTG